MIELSKAGLSVNDTLDASRGVLALAKAGQLETAEAAAISANALLAFSLKGTEATRVADLLAAAANASSSDVRGMGDSMAQVSAVAAQTRRPVEDVVTQIALLANQGIKGSDAGTSLKTMLMALTPKSKEAGEAMAALGVSAYDSSGKMKSTREIIGLYSEKLAKLTDEQRDQTLQTIFGSDAMRAASILIRGGTAEYDKMAGAVTKSGAAQKNAAAYTAGLKGNIEAINSSLETISLTIGQKVLPFVQVITGAIAGWISENQELATAIAIGGVTLLGLVAIITAVAGAAAVLVPAIGAVAAILGVSGAVAAGLFFAIPVAIAACVALIITYWTPISSFFSNLWKGIGDVFQTAIVWIGEKVAWLKDHFWETVGFIIGFFATLPIKLPFYVFAAIGAIINWLSKIDWNQVFAAIGNAAKGVFDWITDLGVRVWLFLKNIKWGEVFAAAGKGIANGILGLIEGGINGALSGLPGNPKVKLPRFATGTNFAPGGYAWVGENGPELINVPRGSQVKTAAQSRELAGRQGGTVTIGEVHVHNEADEDRLIRSISLRFALG